MDPQLELKFFERLKIDKPIKIDYLKRIVAGINIGEGVIVSWNAAKLPDKPKYILVGFKDLTSNQKTNNSLFIQATADDKQLKSLQVQLNTAYYPMTEIKFNKKDNEQLHPFLNYCDMCKLFGQDPQLSYVDFKNLYSIFCFDVSAQPYDLEKYGCDVTIHITKDEALKLMCYCVILAEKHVEIQVQGGKMKMVV